MKDIRELRATQIYLLPTGSVPMEALLTTKGREGMREAVGVQDPPLAPWPSELGPVPEIRFANGEVQVDGNSIRVTSLVFQPRRILLNVSGTSEQADHVFGEVSAVLTNLAPDRADILSRIVYKAEEAACIVTLDVDLRKVFRSSVWRFFTKDVAGTASEPNIPAKVWPSRIAATIYYDLQDETIKEHGITLAAKEFVIEPRPGVPLHERVFVTRSPFRSDVHLKLLQEFETALK